MSLNTAVRSYRDRLGPAVVETVRRASPRVPALRSRLEASGVDPDAGSLTLDDLDAVPVLAKDDLPALQRKDPPFGGLVPDDADVVRVFASPGPIYEAQVAGPDPWGWAPALEACGVGRGDVVLNCLSYHLSPAGAMFDEAVRSLGATVVPAGVGAAEVQARLVADLHVTAYVGLPSYLAALLQTYDDAGLPADRWRVEKALVTAEPLPEALREQLCERVTMVLMAYGTAEAGLVGYETEPGGGLALPERVLVEVCDPGTGRPVEDAEQPGEVVVSVARAEHPLLRFGTGDVSRWQLGPDGAPRLAGILGRVGAAVKVRGMFVHPHQARAVVEGLRAHGADNGRFVVERPADRDVLRLELVCAEGADRTALEEAAATHAQQRLRVRPEVQLVESVGDDVLVDERDWG